MLKRGTELGIRLIHFLAVQYLRKTYRAYMTSTLIVALSYEIKEFQYI